MLTKVQLKTIWELNGSHPKLLLTLRAVEWFLSRLQLTTRFSNFLWSFNNVKLLSKTNPGPFFRHYDALAMGFSANFLSQWEQLNSSQKTVSLMCSLVTNQLITDRKGATQIVNNNLLWGVSAQSNISSCAQ